jgi:hypothetical protein
MGVNGQHHALATLYTEERTPGTHWIGGWVGLIAGLDTEARRKIQAIYIYWFAIERASDAWNLYYHM